MGRAPWPKPSAPLAPGSRGSCRPCHRQAGEGLFAHIPPLDRHPLTHLAKLVVQVTECLARRAVGSSASGR
ncbi:hypothetical protein RKD20_006675 [Streptomyces sp. SLBN-8D4]